MKTKIYSRLRRILLAIAIGGIISFAIPSLWSFFSNLNNWPKTLIEFAVLPRNFNFLTLIIGAAIIPLLVIPTLGYFRRLWPAIESGLYDPSPLLWFLISLIATLLVQRDK